MKNESTLKYAEHKLDEAIKQGEPDETVAYWRGYRDCAKALEKDRFSDTTKMVKLTLDQLREMDGKPVLYKRSNQWFTVELNHPDFRECIINAAGFFIPLKTAAERGAYAYPFAQIDTEEWTAEWIYPENEFNLPKCSKCGCNSKDATYGHKDNFCPKCGRAMKPEAWAELEKRMRV